MPGARHYTAEQQAFLREHAATMTRGQLAEAFNARFNESRGENAIRMQCTALGLPTAPRGAWKQRKRGSEHWGLFTDDGRKRSEEALRRAHEANRKHKDGDLVIKSGRPFFYQSLPEKLGRYKYRLVPASTAVWEAAHGPIKPKHRLVHLDGDVMNYALENLREVPWRQLALLRDIGGLTDDRRTNETKLAWCALRAAIGGDAK